VKARVAVDLADHVVVAIVLARTGRVWARNKVHALDIDTMELDGATAVFLETSGVVG
jgi:hypothetical protein